MEGLCVPGVTQAVVVAILYLCRMCDVRMYRSCAGVVTRGLPLRGRSAVRPVLGISQYGHCNLLLWPHLQSSCLLAACLRYVHADEQGPWASFFWCFSESVEKLLLVSYVFITVTLIAYRLSAVSVLTTVPQVHVH